MTLSLVAVVVSLAWAQLVLLAASVVGDVVHAVLHLADEVGRGPRRQGVLGRLGQGVLRVVGGLHRRHHEWIDARYRVHPQRFAANVVFHQVPEELMQAALCAAWVRVLDLRAGVLALCVLRLAFRLVHIIRVRGLDDDHTAPRPLPAPRGGLFVDAAYHALHHVHPRQFLSARVAIVDVLLGTALPIAGQRIRVVADAAGRAFAVDLVAALAAAGGDAHVVDADADAAVDVDEVVDFFVCVCDAASCAAALARAQDARHAALTPLFFFSVDNSAAWRARAPLLVGERTVWRTLVRGPRLGAGVALALMRRGLSL